MHLFFSLCVAVLVSHSCETVYSDWTEDESYVTPTPDYDYNSTFDYYFVTGGYNPDQDEDQNENQDEYWDRDTRGQAPESSHLTTSLFLLGLATAGHML